MGRWFVCHAPTRSALESTTVTSMLGHLLAVTAQVGPPYSTYMNSINMEAAVGTAPTTYPAPRQQILLMLLCGSGISEVSRAPFRVGGKTLSSELKVSFILARVVVVALLIA